MLLPSPTSVEPTALHKDIAIEVQKAAQVTKKSFRTYTYIQKHIAFCVGGLECIDKSYRLITS